MANEPDRVELLEHGQVKMRLTESHPKSLNNVGGYGGRATSARIFGSAGSVVTFFDDQEFRTGQNSVLIEKKVDAPIEVFISQKFVDTNEEKGDGTFMGEQPEYKWALFKSIKKDWFRENIPLDWDGIRRKAKEEGAKSEVMKVAGDVIEFFGMGDTTSNNFQVDNCSSVRFGR